MFSGRQPPQDVKVFPTFLGVSRSPSSGCCSWLGKTKPPTFLGVSRSPSSGCCSWLGKTKPPFLGVSRSPSSGCCLWLGKTKPPATTFHWILSPRKLQYYITLLVINRSHFLGSFQMSSRNNSSVALRCPSWTTDWPVSLPLLKHRSQLNTVLRGGAFSPRIADNRRRMSDGLTPSFHSNHVVHRYPWESPWIFCILSMRLEH